MHNHRPVPQLPALSEDLITALEYYFPDRAPDLHTPDNAIWYNAGAASVVRWLRQQYAEQQSGDELLPSAELPLTTLNQER